MGTAGVGRASSDAVRPVPWCVTEPRNRSDLPCRDATASPRRGRSGARFLSTRRRLSLTTMTGLCWSRGFRSGRSTGTGRVLLKLNLHCPRCDPGSVALDIGNPTSRQASAIRRLVFCVPERLGFSPAPAATGNVRQVSLESTWYPIRRSGALGRRSRFAARPLRWSDLDRLLELADGPAPCQISIPEPAIWDTRG